jgi:hypothetical protein
VGIQQVRELQHERKLVYETSAAIEFNKNIKVAPELILPAGD